MPYQHFIPNDDLNKIVDYLTREGLPEFWPITDLLHLMKNSRTRIVLGSQAFNVTSQLMTADNLDATLGIVRPLSARKALDLIKDELALGSLRPDNRLRRSMRPTWLGFIS
jgi:hypothetical protein